ncbi:MAG: bifunctional folylpolyglutamate synthase/dihydrofolate synthase [Cyanobacteria bacterium J083]|nr:MAG: bifunctional folylpolyglutamate synthase/dihydrofolate synthase [Cyanobacteria bacterium J083]
MGKNSQLDSFLKSFEHFGVNLGLKRISKLLANLDNPQQKVPIIHVAGSNGKGSVCAYLSSILTEAGYRVGRYTSPHLVTWTERICLNNQPINEAELISILHQVKQVIEPSIMPTQFEVITAAAWLYFAQSEVDIAVIEVGLGGRLDATNVCPNPLISVIVSLSKEHWQRLGATVADIAREKAGILKTNCPAVIGQLPLAAKAVVKAKIAELNCQAYWVEPAKLIKQDYQAEKQLNWAKYNHITYPLPLLGQIQLTNSAIALTCIEILQKQGWFISPQAIQTGMAKTVWLGRLQWTSWRGQTFLIDGAHNPAAAKALREYIDTLNRPISWVMGMLSTKDHLDIFNALLRPKDKLYLVPVPEHSTAKPEELAILASQACPQLDSCQTFPELFIALNAAFSEQAETERLVVFCGSLYLIGYFFAQTRQPT